MRIPVALAAAALTLGLAGCAEDEPTADATGAPTTSASSEPAPTATEPSEPSEPAMPEGVVVDVTIAGGEVTPQGDRVEVEVGEPVTLRVTSDEADEIHVHSDPEHSLEVEAGTPGELTFTVDRPGQVAVESHHLDVTIVQLVAR
ncbi:hypothetical protein [Aeromicrobium sp. IC_218]|uniref:hypothetical protein n=1 Tax=Aeromicrobium sp. IC_218 TaxID=2545468 RepID=UPI00103D03AE|nr:hypothetical protein [Aeromicrobium sp. IC_218]TCI99028.1 hypothetical protein E0W78_07435 [Aeromicrobium sp. IC_218]